MTKIKDKINELKRKKLSDKEISDLLTEEFKGGTLVEYENFCGFRREFGRAVIDTIVLDKKSISIEPGKKIEGPRRGASLYWHDYTTISYTQQGKITYMDVPMLYCYSMAPPGVHMPKPGEHKNPEETTIYVRA